MAGSRRRANGGMAYIEANIFRGLTFKSIAQREDWNQLAPTYISGLLRLNSAADVTVFANDQKGYIAQQNSYGYTTSFDSYFTFIKTLSRNHNFNAVLGMRYSDNTQNYEAMYGDNIVNSNLIYPSLTARVNNQFQTAVQDDVSSNLGYYFRAQYNYKRRYLLTALVNRDGSSRFGDKQKFGTFPAFSAGWIVSDEPFMKNNRLFSFLKLRSSFGLTGNSAGIGNLSSKSTWQSSGSSGYMSTSSNSPNQPGNASLQWEKGTKFDAGVDFGFMKDRLTATIDVYRNTTDQMLLSIPTPLTYGYSAPGSDLTFLENRGGLTNQGIELAINANILTGKFTWRSTFNISHNETRIVSLGGLDPNIVSGGTGDVQLYPGRVAPVFYLIEYVGVDPETGGEWIRDEAGKVVLATSLGAEALNKARKPQYDKPPAPKFYGGFGNSFAYKAFSLNIFFSYRYGNYLLDAGERTMSYVGNISAANNSTTPNIFLGNLPVSIMNRWTPENKTSDIPKVYYNDPTNNPLRNRNTTRFLSDASYLRLKNVVLSYNISEKLLSRVKIKNARVALTGQNLLLFTRFKGVDPEAITIQTNYRERNVAYGIIRNTIPQTKTLTLALNIGF